MSRRILRIAPSLALGLVWLSACTTANQPSLEASAGAAIADPVTTSAAPVPAGTAVSEGGEAQEGTARGKIQFRAGNYGLAEQEFRRAVEASPRDAEAWLGLAASYDRLKRFELADRAYGQATKLVGATPELLNNQGYSYMLRGDLKRAYQALMAAKTIDPNNPYVENNLALLQASTHLGEGVP